MRIGLALLFLFCLIPAAHAELFEDTLQRAIPAVSGGKLVLDTEYGDIELTTGGSNQVSIDVYRRVSARDKAEADSIFNDFELDTKSTGKEVVVHGIFKNGWESGTWGEFCHNGNCLSYGRKLKRFVYRIQIPKKFTVDIATLGGDIFTDDIDGDVQLSTSGGDIRVGNVAGGVRVDTSGGDIRIGDTSADIEAKTSGGDIQISSGKNVMAETSGGDIDILAARGIVSADTSGGDVKVHLMEQPKGDCRMETSGGDVVVYLPASSKMNLDARTGMGEIDVEDFKITVDTRDEDRLQGKLNGGGPDLILRSSSGDIVIRSQN